MGFFAASDFISGRLGWATRRWTRAHCEFAIEGCLPVAAMAQSRGRPGLALTIAGWGFAAGTLIFSNSLFAAALTGNGSLGMITPFGGVGLLVGWAALAAHALSGR